MKDNKNRLPIHQGFWREVKQANPYSNPSPALFVDRDGTIIRLIDYLDNPELVILIPEVIEIIHTANQCGIRVVMITNQSGISRGFFNWEKFALVQNMVIDKCEKKGARFDAIYACPDHPDNPSQYRKPNPGMFFTAQVDLNINLSESLILGDAASDLLAGKRAGLHQSWLAPTGHGKRDKLLALELEDSSFKVNITNNYQDLEKALLILERKFS
ncbi:MAG: HAD family hydrolase [Rhodospirillaceae bacterium]|nr:HAD family hydrolase [Rhodospirillaceae bacterium]